MATCLESLTQQTLKDIEIVIVDDGSTDNTKLIVERYADSDARISLVSQENLGTSVARNVGLRRSSGEYVLFVDSDDWISPDACESLYDRACSENIDLLIYDYCFVYHDKKVFRNCHLPIGITSGISYLERALERDKLTLSPCNKLIRRELAERID
ncbi:MAG: glycosyltransferase family 2 protein, partial [Desulfuromonadales bacterium]|nr:glycosyltransferase family 2 protein [Desulfuromonadales bacterium]